MTYLSVSCKLYLLIPTSHFTYFLYLPTPLFWQVLVCSLYLWVCFCFFFFFKPECTGTAAEATGSTLLMMAARIIGYAYHRRKPFCSALIPSGSFTFWRIEKNELKIKIISLIWLHPRFMAAAFKGNLTKKKKVEFTSVPFLVFQYFINVMSKVNLWGHY